MTELYLYYLFQLMDAHLLRTWSWTIGYHLPFLSLWLSSSNPPRPILFIPLVLFFHPFFLPFPHLEFQRVPMVLFSTMACCGRSLDSPCTLALLIGFQFAFVLYFSLGGFRGLVSVLVHTTEPEFDYSRPHDVYTNLSHLGVAPPLPRNSSTGLPASGQPLRDCPSLSPLLGERCVCWGCSSHRPNHACLLHW